MTGDLPPLGIHRRPGSPPRPEVLDAVVREGRRRVRRSAAAVVGALAMVCVVAVGALVLGGTSEDALVIVPASPAPAASRSPLPVLPDVVPPLDASPRVVPPTALAGPGDAPPAPGGPGPAATVQAPVLSAPAADRRPVRPRTIRPYMEAPQISSYPELCSSGHRFEADGYQLCVTAQAQGEARSGESISVQQTLCSSRVNTRRYSLAFASGREHEVQVRPSDIVDEFLWTWSRGHTFPQGDHERMLDPGSCLTWVTAWDTRDDSGRLVPAGTYRLEASVDVNGRVETVAVPTTVTLTSP